MIRFLQNLENVNVDASLKASAQAKRGMFATVTGDTFAVFPILLTTLNISLDIKLLNDLDKSLLKLFLGNSLPLFKTDKTSFNFISLASGEL